jgi:hypothetical protein
VSNGVQLAGLYDPELALEGSVLERTRVPRSLVRHILFAYQICVSNLNGRCPYFRFGTSTKQRRRLALRLRRWIELAQRVAAHRLFVDGSFVTSNPEPNDVDAVVRLADDFVDRVSRGDSEAVELETMLLTRRPEEIFAAEDRRDWDAWVGFFSRTREVDGWRKGIVEVEL